MNKQFILVVDDEPNIRFTLTGLLADEGFQAESFPTGEEALTFIKSKSVNLIFLDIWLKEEYDGLALLKDIKAIDDSIQVIMISGHGTIDLAVKCIKAGAFDFLEKPLSAERILVTLQNALAYQRLYFENKVFKSILAEKEQILGESTAMLQIRQTMQRIAQTNANVLITGENGTGKELLARSIHTNSARKDKAFISLNCAAIPSGLIESELFGYEKGAFSGAEKRKLGKIEMADAGSLFLDEIGDMAPGAQAKVLRVLETGEFERLGSTRTLSVDVRLISATNQDIPELISANRFRQDLYYRLNVIPMHLPPLRERQQDIPLLARHFLRFFGTRYRSRVPDVSEQAIAHLRAYPWPGNVRELKNYMQRLVIMVDAQYIKAGHLLPPVSREREPAAETELKSLKAAREAFERDYIQKVLDHTDGNITKTANILGMERTSLHRKLKALNMANNS